MVTQVAATYADLYTWENLYTAYQNAVRGKRSRGAAAAFTFQLEDNLCQLQEELAAESYRLVLAADLLHSKTMQVLQSQITDNTPAIVID